MGIPLARRLGAEFLGTFWLVFGGCGSAVLASYVLKGDNSSVNLGIGFAGVALAFGLTVLTMASTRSATSPAATSTPPSRWGCAPRAALPRPTCSHTLLPSCSAGCSALPCCT